ncbi:ZIP family metal transporter [Candidatus Woesearchaeota archaeon]|nr:MAG: ZIP family metal transporter [Candidatus Woesearchaeota archaeon]
MQWAYPLLSVILVSAVAFIGLWTFAVQAKKLERIVLYLVSFSAGGLLGDAFIHLLPEAVSESGFGFSVSLYILLGIIISFIIEKIIWRHCHLHKCTAGHHHARPQPFAYLNLIGDGVHNFIDGLIIGASYLVSIPVGISTTLAVIFHEIPQEIGDFGVLIHGGFERAQALFYNFLSGLVAVLGVVVALTLHQTTAVTAFLIPFAAGNFIYIACTDLLPELHKSVAVKESLLQVLAFLAGIGVMVLILLVE